jgi:hypothetical protein
MIAFIDDHQDKHGVEPICPCHGPRTMYGWLLRGKGFSGDVGVISAAAIYTASDLQHDRCAP